MAQGRVYTGLQALELGLVDELGTLKDAFQVAKREAGLDESKLYPIHRYEPAQFSLSECFSSMAKMRRCFRRHGNHARTSIKEEILGEEGKILTSIQRMTNLARSERVMTLYTGSLPQ